MVNNPGLPTARRPSAISLTNTTSSGGGHRPVAAITHCKRRCYGSGDKFCPPIQGNERTKGRVQSPRSQAQSRKGTGNMRLEIGGTRTRPVPQLEVLHGVHAALVHRVARLSFLDEGQTKGLAERFDRAAQVAVETDSMPPPLVPFAKQLVEIAFDFHG